MKQYITMLKIESGGYQRLEKMNSIFFALTRLFTNQFSPGKLIDWLMDDKETVEGNELVDIRKECGIIVLHDMSDAAYDETISPYEFDPTKRFEMSVKNFAEILFEWEILRVSRPDIILIIIHEDNHVSLESDPLIIKEYQDAGYAFDINKN